MEILNKIVDRNKFLSNIYPEKCIGYSYIPAIHDKVYRIIVLGDIHGDYNLLINMLKIAELIEIDNNKIIWIGNNTYVVQVGDQIDRCRPYGNKKCIEPDTTYMDEASDIKILNLCNDLHKQALKYGGAFISLFGNHELMNVDGDMRYVSYLGFKEFDNYIDPNNLDLKFKNGVEARKYAFKPGNQIANMMACTRLACVNIGKHLFVHAGIIDSLISEINITDINDIETINIAIRLWILGLLKREFVSKIIDKSNTSLFWTRILGHIPPNVSLNDHRCINHIGNVLNLFKVGSIIVGHTPQSFMYSDNINQTCQGRVWRVDNGSSKAFSYFDNEIKKTNTISYSRRPQVLEIINDEEYYIIDESGRHKTAV